MHTKKSENKNHKNSQFQFTKMSRKKHQRNSLIVAFAMFFLSAFFCQTISAQESKNSVQEINFTKDGSLKISLSKKTDFKIFALENPNRLVVDIANCALEKPATTFSFPSFVKSFRTKSDGDSLRIVFDLENKISVKKTKFERSKDENKGNITAEISGLKNNEVSDKNSSKADQDFILSKVAQFDVETRKIDNPDGTSKFVIKKIPRPDNDILAAQNSGKKSSRMLTIVIDAGHGGKDPGTIGTFARTKEKNLTLSYAKELGKHLLKTGRYRVFLTRVDDTFIPLRQRVEIARKKKADLFVSIHANAAANSEAQGFSIYTLSETSSDKQAELLAQKENRADIINGVNFSGASEDIVKTLIDLSQRESKNSSSRFAASAVNSMKNSQINILQNTHRFAGFAVLTAPDMASVLIELGYLSNKHEEDLLNSLPYKRKVAIGLTKAIDNYFSKT